MPGTFSINTHDTVVMISERAADFILGFATPNPAHPWTKPSLRRLSGVVSIWTRNIIIRIDPSVAARKEYPQLRAHRSDTAVPGFSFKRIIANFIP